MIYGLGGSAEAPAGGGRRRALVRVVAEISIFFHLPGAWKKFPRTWFVEIITRYLVRGSNSQLPGVWDCFPHRSKTDPRQARQSQETGGPLRSIETSRPMPWLCLSSISLTLPLSLRSLAHGYPR